MNLIMRRRWRKSPATPIKQSETLGSGSSLAVSVGIEVEADSTFAFPFASEAGFEFFHERPNLGGGDLPLVLHIPEIGNDENGDVVWDSLDVLLEVLHRIKLQFNQNTECTLRGSRMKKQALQPW